VKKLTGPEPVAHCADALDHLRTVPDASVDVVVTDPPYELGFLGKAWDASGIAYSVELWAECLRLLKPGGHLAAFGATRTYHRLTVAVEDAGFEIRDLKQTADTIAGRDDRIQHDYAG
jgi:site-specific DNA-methyltransferase (adenine-specific)